MDPQTASRLRKPSRTNSAPGNPNRRATTYIPLAFSRALLSKRDETFERAPAWKASKLNPQDAEEEGEGHSTPTPEDSAQVSEGALSPQDTATVTPPSGVVINAEEVAVVDTLEDNDVQDILAQIAASSDNNEDDDDDGSIPLAAAATGLLRRRVTQPPASSTFDLEEMSELLEKLRHTTGKCSPKVEEFAKGLWESIGEGEKAWQMFERSKMSKEATPLVRRRRLFGEKEPALHQRVLGVLNKVTDDAEKYREIKHELMRLPLPEADPASLDLVVQCFFTKAVREQQFSSYYADLVEELCRIPKGQVQTGKESESLSYRLRVALVQRCQREFQSHKSLSSLPKVNDQGKPYTADELEQRRIAEKKKLCGNVKFVGELYLRKMVSARVVQFVIIMLLCGTNNKEALLQPLPPLFIPEENECDQLITLLKTVGEALLLTDIGRETIGRVRPIVGYLALHHPALRTQFLLQELIEIMDRNFAKPVIPTQAELMRKEVEEAQKQHAAAMHIAVPTIASSGGSVGGGGGGMNDSRQASFTSPLDFATPQRNNNSSFSTSPTPSLGGSNSNKYPPNRNTGGGGRGSAGTSPTATLANSPQAPGMSPFGRVNAVTPPPQQLAPPLPMPANRVAATSESIAALVAQLVTTSDFEAAAHQLVHGFVNLFLALELWLVRSMSLIKADKERGQLGELLATLHGQHGVPIPPLRDTALAALRKCMDKELHEIMRLWKFWGQVVAGDASCSILNDDLHNDALNEILKYFAGNEKAQAENARQFILDVLNVQLLKPAECVAPSVKTRYARFRPLRCLVLFAHRQKLEGFVRDVLTHPTVVKAQDFELSTFTTLMYSANGGTTGVAELKAMYSNPANAAKYVDPVAVAKVLSAIFFAEISTDGKNFLETNLELLRFVADGRDRETRELCVIAELYDATIVTKDLFAFGRTMLHGSRWMTRLLHGGIVTKESKMEADRIYKDDPEAAYAIAPPITDEMHTFLPPPRERLQGRK